MPPVLYLFCTALSHQLKLPVLNTPDHTQINREKPIIISCCFSIDAQRVFPYPRVKHPIRECVNQYFVPSALSVYLLPYLLYAMDVIVSLFRYPGLSK